MPTVADVLRRYGRADLECFGESMIAGHEKVLAAITACRTDQWGGMLYEWASWGATYATLLRPPALATGRSSLRS